VALRKLLRLVTGCFLILLGVLGLILPIMPGWIFLIPGLIMVSDYFPPVKRLLEWAKAKAQAVRQRPQSRDKL
jgi:uncharacterized membrane protein YbaN (DUF454 family)